MKQEVVHNHNSEKVLDKVPINPALNKYSNVVLFPKKVAKAKEAFERLGLPKVNQQGR